MDEARENAVVLQAVIDRGASWTATRWISRDVGFEAGPALVRLMKAGQIRARRQPWGTTWRRGRTRDWHVTPEELSRRTG